MITLPKILGMVGAKSNAPGDLGAIMGGERGWLIIFTASVALKTKVLGRAQMLETEDRFLGDGGRIH